MKLQRGDLVRIADPWSGQDGHAVVLLKHYPDSDSWDFIIPEQRGSVPTRMIERLISHDMLKGCKPFPPEPEWSESPASQSEAR